MRRFGIVLLAAAFLAPVSASGATEFQHCTEDFQRISHLRKIHASCDKARWVAHRFDQKVMEAGEWPDDGALRVGRFRCTSAQKSYETYRITCTRRGGSVVKFQWGV